MDLILMSLLKIKMGRITNGLIGLAALLGALSFAPVWPEKLGKTSKVIVEGTDWVFNARRTRLRFPNPDGSFIKGNSSIIDYCYSPEADTLEDGRIYWATQFRRNNLWGLDLRRIPCVGNLLAPGHQYYVLEEVNP